MYNDDGNNNTLSKRYVACAIGNGCRKLSNEDKMDNLVISNMPKTDDATSEIVAKEGRLPLRHSGCTCVD